MLDNVKTIKLKIRKNDLVEVIAGREKGKSGRVVSVDSKNSKIKVEKVNMMKRHVKPSQKYPQGGLIEKEAPLHYSNVLLMCPKCNRGVRHSNKVVTAAKSGKKSEKSVGKKARFCKKCETNLDVAV